MPWSDPPRGLSLVLGPAPGRAGTATAAVDALARAGLVGVVSLLPEADLPDGLAEACAEAGLRWLHRPVVDFAAPTADDIRVVDDFVSELSGTAYLHCWAGLGRAGTVAAALLVRRGWTADDALAEVRRVRPGAVESAVQEAFVRGYSGMSKAKSISSPSSPSR